MQYGFMLRMDPIWEWEIFGYFGGADTLTEELVDDSIYASLLAYRTTCWIHEMYGQNLRLAINLADQAFRRMWRNADILVILTSQSYLRQFKACWWAFHLLQLVMSLEYEMRSDEDHHTCLHEQRQSVCQWLSSHICPKQAWSGSSRLVLPVVPAKLRWFLQVLFLPTCHISHFGVSTISCFVTIFCWLDFCVSIQAPRW